jgi:hypothetical protein
MTKADADSMQTIDPANFLSEVEEKARATNDNNLAEIGRRLRAAIEEGQPTAGLVREAIAWRRAFYLANGR